MPAEKVRTVRKQYAPSEKRTVIRNAVKKFLPQSAPTGGGLRHFLKRSAQRRRMGVKEVKRVRVCAAPRGYGCFQGRGFCVRKSYGGRVRTVQGRRYGVRAGKGEDTAPGGHGAREKTWGAHGAGRHAKGTDAKAVRSPRRKVFSAQARRVAGNGAFCVRARSGAEGLTAVSERKKGDCKYKFFQSGQ